MVAALSLDEAERVTEAVADPDAHRMNDERKTFVAVGGAFRVHDTLRHSQRERKRVRGGVHGNPVESINDHVRRTIAGVSH